MVFSLPVASVAGVLTLCAGLFAGRRRVYAHWRARRLSRPPVTGPFYASVLMIAIKLGMVVCLLSLAIGVWVDIGLHWKEEGGFLTALAALFALIPAYMGFTYWSGPGKLAARHLRLSGGHPVLTLQQDGFRYLSLAKVSWPEVLQIQYITRERAQGKAGPAVAVQLEDASAVLRPAQPVDLWAYGRHLATLTRWVDIDTQYWLVLDLNNLAGATAEQAAHWMAALQAQHRVAPANGLPDKKDTQHPG